MKKQMLLIALVMAMVGVLAFTTGALAPNPVAAAPGGGGPGGGGGGGGDDVIPDYGDLIILYRDADGVPIPSPEIQVEDPETGLEVDGGLCRQPIAFNVEDEAACPESCVVPSVPAGADVVDVNQYTCGVTAGCSGCTQEVDFGRINQARSPDTVFESQLEDVVINVATADCRTLDPAGRMVASRVGDDDVVVSRTIDSPLQNLAIYRQLMLTGDIGAPLPDGVDVLDTAARGLGVASDKGGEVNVDMVAYVNSNMGLDDVPTILDPKICETYREEVQGTIQLVEKCFLNYGPVDEENPGHGYDRGPNFGALPAPAYIGAPNDGWFEYLSFVAGTDPYRFEIVQGPITTAVFADESGFTDGNIGGFAQLADDTRAVINFMHDWPMPDADVYGTAVPCAADPDLVAYDVGFSDVSGLQVPKQLVDGSEGREFTVTVANASGSADPATGTVTVTATAENDGTIEGSPWTFMFTDLAPGSSDSWTMEFSIDLGQRTTINWTAVAAAEFDVNASNNTVTATSNVRVTAGGGGGGE